MGRFHGSTHGGDGGGGRAARRPGGTAVARSPVPQHRAGHPHVAWRQRDGALGACGRQRTVDPQSEPSAQNGGTVETAECRPNPVRMLSHSAADVGEVAAVSPAGDSCRPRMDADEDSDRERRGRANPTIIIKQMHFTTPPPAAAKPAAPRQVRGMAARRSSSGSVAATQQRPTRRLREPGRGGPKARFSIAFLPMKKPVHHASQVSAEGGAA